MNKAVFTLIASLLVVAGLIGTAVNTKNGKGKHAALKTTKRPIDSLCGATNNQNGCVNSLSSVANATDPGQVVKASFQVAKTALLDAISKSETIKASKTDPRAAQALEVCSEVMTYALNDLEKSVNSTGKLDNAPDINQFMEDLKVWMGAVLTYQDVCFDAFLGAQDTDPGMKMRQFFNTSRELTRNALGMMDKAKELIGFLNIPSLFGGGHRRMLLQDAVAAGPAAANPGGQLQAGELPAWIKDAQRKLLDKPVASIKPDATVALDGSGQYKSVAEALAKNPNSTAKPYIVYVKAGTYKESITVAPTQDNVVLIGDGVGKTIITDAKNFLEGLPTFKTATASILGAAFMAKDITFQNSAGAEKHQAVAMRVTGDYAVFFNCEFDGYQDTLYTVVGRQFYRDCTIKGTVDFIFGDAATIFQNCQIVVRKPLENQQAFIAAQGRSDINGPGALIFQNCTITADPAYTPEALAVSKAYLGRPWKMFSRTIIIQSSIDAFIAPEGWKEWSGTTGVESLFFVEFKNRGPGAAQEKRVKWPGIKKLSESEVTQFTPESFYKGGQWVTPTGAPYAPGMIAGL